MIKQRYKISSCELIKGYQQIFCCIKSNHCHHVELFNRAEYLYYFAKQNIKGLKARQFLVNAIFLFLMLLFVGLVGFPITAEIIF